MNLEKNIDEYKKRYKGLIEALKIWKKIWKLVRYFG
jgi:hypothetical protein